VARFRLGTAFLGRYVLLGEVGQGGVSVVYQAFDTLRGRNAAIKMLDPTMAGDLYAKERIRREAMITDRVRHPSVPKIYDYGDAPLSDGTVVPYVVMELLAGAMLSARMADGPLPWPEAVRVAATVADVLTVAHRRGVVHRDLSAANIMISPEGTKIIDFGVAVTVDVPDRGKGPYVVPPKQQRPRNDFAGEGEPADDVYALGVLLYQMVTGRSPYPTTDPNAPPVAGGAIRWVAPTPVLAVPGLPREVAEICRHCMAKRPGERPDAAAVALELWALIVPAPDTPDTPTGLDGLALPELPALPSRPEPPRSPPPHAPGLDTSTGHRRGGRRWIWPGWLGPTHDETVGARG
jgi:serine/threonine protein kinase